MKKFVLFAALLSFFSGTSMAYDVPIDSFDNAVNTAALTSIANSMEMATDDPVEGVIGGSRTVQAQGTILCQTDILAGLFNYMSFGDAAAILTYDGGGEGLGNALACAEAIEITYQDADAPAQGIGTPVLAIAVSLDGETVGQLVSAEAGTLSFPLTDFPGADLENLGMLRVGVANTDTASADILISSITAVNCEPPDVPAPSVGPFGLVLGIVVVTGLGLLGIARRRTL